MSSVVDVSKKLDAEGGTSICTAMGHGFDIQDPQTWVFDIGDISTALANTCRYGGHVDFYSVAEHSVRVASLLRGRGESTKVVLMGLLHDATETYIGDIPRPIKKSLMIQDEFGDVMPFSAFEEMLAWYLMSAYDLAVAETWEAEWARIKQADMDVYVTERSERPQVGKGLNPIQARDEFMGMFTILWKDFTMKAY